MALPTTITRQAPFLWLVLAFIQLFDLIIHVVSDQIEPLRITANVIILLWVALAARGGTKHQHPIIAGGAISLYLLLNLIFLTRAGLTNPAQGGQIRIMLLLLVGVTVALALGLRRQRAR
ncbi:MAG: hypothetical protein KF832_05510 [Caldilineaceae bacterium]|nr:hypothetical protein [Caldilineaceae bacterium]